MEPLHSFSWQVCGGLFAFTVGMAARAWGTFHLGLRRCESGNRLRAQAI